MEVHDKCTKQRHHFTNTGNVALSPLKTSVCCYAAVFWEKQPSEQRNTSSIQASGAIQLKQVLTTGIYEVFPA